MGVATQWRHGATCL